MQINKTISVTYKTKEEFRKLLTLLADEGWKWFSGHSPLFFLDEYYSNNVSLAIDKDKTLTIDISSSNNMTYYQFIKKYVETEVIVNGEVYV